MNIAILGWGSLLWEGGRDFDTWHGPWQDDGPSLKIEFSRISTSRLGALTLVIDEDHGTPNTVAWCLSKRTSLEDAIFDLRNREQTTIGNIARATVTPEDSTRPDSPIIAWARTKNLNHVIWTALKTNFKQRTGQSFSTLAAIGYLKSLDAGGKAKAAEYVWRAPMFVKTDLRSAVQKEPWFSENTV